MVLLERAVTEAGEEVVGSMFVTQTRIRGKEPLRHRAADQVGAGSRSWSKWRRFRSSPANLGLSGGPPWHPCAKQSRSSDLQVCLIVEMTDDDFICIMKAGGA
jgi:hypothetical protein